MFQNLSKLGTDQHLQLSRDAFALSVGGSAWCFSVDLSPSEIPAVFFFHLLVVLPRFSPKAIRCVERAPPVQAVKPRCCGWGRVFQLCRGVK